MCDRAVLVAAALALAASSCGAAPPATSTVPAPLAVPVPVPSPSAAAPRESERTPLRMLAEQAGAEWLAAFAARDADRLASVYTEDACVTVDGRARLCGRAAIAEAARATWGKVPEARAAWGRAFWTGEVLAVESAWSTEARGATALALCWFSPDGRVREERVYVDGRAALPAPSGAKGRPFDGLPTTREAHASTGAASEQENLDLVRATFAAPPIADDAELVDYAQPGTLAGRKGAARWTGARVSGLSGGRAALTKAWAVEGYVLGEVEATGKRAGEAVTLHAAELVEIEGGRVKRAWRYGDAADAPSDAKAPAAYPLAVP
jgi:hypothetical protein